MPAAVSVDLRLALPQIWVEEAGGDQPGRPHKIGASLLEAVGQGVPFRAADSTHPEQERHQMVSWHCSVL